MVENRGDIWVRALATSDVAEAIRRGAPRFGKVAAPR